MPIRKALCAVVPLAAPATAQTLTIGIGGPHARLEQRLPLRAGMSGRSPRAVRQAAN